LREAEGEIPSAYSPHFPERKNFLHYGRQPQKDIKKIYIHLTRTMPVSLEYSMLQVNSYGGKINEINKELTAVWQRDSIFKLQYQTYWPMIENEKLLKDYETFNLKWIRDFYTDIYISYGGTPDPDPASGPNTKFDGCYINYPDIDLNQYGLRKALQLYYGGNLPRLIKTKHYWGPNNIFNHSQSIPIL
jgi:hexose oxidase